MPTEPRTEAGRDLLKTADQFGAHGTLGGYVALSKWIAAIEREACGTAASAGADPEPHALYCDEVTCSVHLPLDWIRNERARGGPSLDVERLARAISVVPNQPLDSVLHGHPPIILAEAIAAEYARLAPEPEREEAETRDEVREMYRSTWDEDSAGAEPEREDAPGDARA